MVKAPMNYLTMIQGDGQKLNVDYATALFAELKEGRLVSDFSRFRKNWKLFITRWKMIILSW